MQDKLWRALDPQDKYQVEQQILIDLWQKAHCLIIQQMKLIEVRIAFNFLQRFGRVLHHLSTQILLLIFRETLHLLGKLVRKYFQHHRTGHQ